MISAKELREQVEERQAKDELSKVEMELIAAAAHGEFSAQVEGPLCKKTQKVLEDLGYKYTVYEDYDRFPGTHYYVVSW